MGSGVCRPWVSMELPKPGSRGGGSVGLGAAPVHSSRREQGSRPGDVIHILRKGPHPPCRRAGSCSGKGELGASTGLVLGNEGAESPA